MRYRHLFLGLLTANAASLLFFYGCDLKSGGDGIDPGPTPDSGPDSSIDSGPGGECPGVDTQTDRENCGECKHSCLGGACSAGKCEPARFAAINNPGELAVGDAGVVVTTSTDPGTVLYVPLDGDGGVSTVASNQSSPKGPSTDGTYVCWANGRRVSCSFQDGGAPQSTPDNMNGPNSTQIQGSYAYWLVNGTSELKRLPVEGGAPEPVALGDRSFPLGSRSLVFDGTRLVWVIRDTDSVYGAPSDGDGGAASVLGRVPNGVPNAVAVGQDAYFVAVENSGSDLGGIYRVARDGDGGPATALFRQSLVAPSIAADAQYVYYTNRATSSVYRFKINETVPDGGPPAFASGQSSPASVRLGSDGFVYWANDIPDGGLMRVAK